VQQAFAERSAAGKLELNARLTEGDHWVSGRVQRNLLTNELANSIVLQAAFKTVR
jgi:hypothetical protein